MKSYIFILIKYYLGDQLKDEMSGACSMQGEDDECVQSFNHET
jgi:hypothetical protein